MPSPILFAYGYVKSVLSGDTLVLLGGANPGDAPEEKVVVLSGIQAPRFCRSKNQGNDEPYAWEARDFIRQKVIGKQVAFQTVAGSGSGREYCHVHVDGENLTHSLLKAGLATVKMPPAGTNVSPEKQFLVDMEDKAKNEGKGVHSKDDPALHVRGIDWDPNAEQLVSKYRGMLIPAVINQVRDGSCFRCEVKGSTGKASGNPFMMVTFHLAGAMSPRVPISHDYRMSQHQKKLDADPEYSGDAPEKSEAPAFSSEAVSFSELRLLNRDVQLVMLGMDMSNNIYGVIKYPKGDISKRLLETGLASLVPWSSMLLGDGREALVAAANAAQAKKLRLGGVPPKAADNAEFTGKVVLVSSGDSLLIHDGTKEVRVGLASIRAPRLGRRGEKDAPCAMEAREYLRKRLIGKKVRVLPEYTHTLGTNDRLFATVLHGPVNLGVALAADGLAEVARHRDEDARSVHYAKLVEAQMEAKRSFKGIHAAGAGKAPQITDLSDRNRRRNDDDESGVVGSRARSFLPFLQREKVCNAVVEHVFSATRLKCYVPKENCLLTLALVGVRCPRGDEDFAAEATEYVRSRLLQQNVRVEIETVDKGDNFVGTLWFGPTNIGTALVTEGLGSVMGFSAKRSPHGEELLAAEKAAKEAKLKIWENYVEEVVADDDENEGGGAVKGEMKIKVTEVKDAVTFCYQDLDDANAAKVEALMAEFNAAVPEAGPDKVERGRVYAGLYTDGEWYRVRIEAAVDKRTMQVNFIDYGNQDVLEVANFRELPSAAENVPALAHSALLAGLRAPTKSSEHFEGSAIFFNDLAFDNTMNAKVECVDKGGRVHMTLTDPENKEHSINQLLLRNGWCRRMERPEWKLKPYVAELQGDEDLAKAARYNIWEYGDVSDEEEDDEDAKPQFDGRAGKARAR